MQQLTHAQLKAVRARVRYAPAVDVPYYYFVYLSINTTALVRFNSPETSQLRCGAVVNSIRFGSGSDLTLRYYARPAQWIRILLSELPRANGEHELGTSCFNLYTSCCRYRNADVAQTDFTVLCRYVEVKCIC